MGTSIMENYIYKASIAAVLYIYSVWSTACEITRSLTQKQAVGGSYSVKDGEIECNSTIARISWLKHV